MHASLRKELGARHSLLNLSVYDLVEEFARHRLELEAQLRKASEEEELAKTKKEKREKENERQSLCESRDGNGILHSRRLIGAYILYFKELLSNNGRIFASVIGITRTRAIVLSAIIGHVHFKN
ncbi:hypothetical protein HBH92_161000 [Parastagonospora nodorum]|nr:hypothetical protein HBH92_161000 [Parastagonospora nodorum]KAH4428785.1 hypothetical protein HBH91_242360 [Parastagonospora nodorum]KAH4449546.1 hypothetical protein HBH93_043720 [Parastagonospora nodorum]KAH4495325.1 hypothetical protein HBH89_148950 [Parastagonospora nodorum]KAH4551511.1 hypothetical protein HBH85_038670 [Parastagonospora nodorum]